MALRATWLPNRTSRRSRSGKSGRERALLADQTRLIVTTGANAAVERDPEVRVDRPSTPPLARGLRGLKVVSEVPGAGAVAYLAAALGVAHRTQTPWAGARRRRLRTVALTRRPFLRVLLEAGVAGAPGGLTARRAARGAAVSADLQAPCRRQ